MSSTLAQKFWLISRLFPDQKCQNVHVRSQISWVKLFFWQVKACRSVVMKCNQLKVTQMVNGKAISNKPSVFLFPRPLTSLKDFSVHCIQTMGGKMILRPLILNSPLYILWSRPKSREGVAGSKHWLILGKVYLSMMFLFCFVSISTLANVTRFWLLLWKIKLERKKRKKRWK